MSQVETRNGSNQMTAQFIHGTQYIDEVVMIRAKDKGDLYVHQDANWNVVGLTDLGGRLVERYVYSPYGELIVHQSTGYGDRDGDGTVDSTDKGTPGSTCTTMSGSCRILDLDFDGDYDSNDAGKFDNLSQGLQKNPGKLSSGVSQPFAHQGLLFEPEIGSYQNRARQYEPAQRTFGQWDLKRHFSRNSSPNFYVYELSSPLNTLDPDGQIPLPSDAIGVPCYAGSTDICNSLRNDRDANGQTWFDRDGSDGISFCCYTQNPVYGTITCQHKTCFAPGPVHPCVVQHEATRLQQFTCGMTPVVNPQSQCTDMKCEDHPIAPRCQLDCQVYTQTIQCAQQYGIPLPFGGKEQCILNLLCNTTPCRTIEEAIQQCR